MKLLDVSQLSETINIKKKTIYDWVHRKRIPYIKLGRLVRFDYEEINKWIADRKEQESART